MTKNRLSRGDLLQLQRWNTPTIYNGWEQITRHDRTRGAFNLEETRDLMPEMGAMVGYAITVVIEPGDPAHLRNRPAVWDDYYRFVAEQSDPKIVVVQDLDATPVGSFWGEVNASVHKALGCVGTITDGGVRDLDEMRKLGFKVIARRPCVGHAYSVPVSWGGPVRVFSCEVHPGQLIHADQHGFLAIPDEDQARLLEASLFMDANECDTLIAAAQNCVGKKKDEILQDVRRARQTFRKAVQEKFGEEGQR